MTDCDKSYWTGFITATIVAIIVIVFVLPHVLTKDAWWVTSINGVRVLVAPDGEYYRMPKAVKLSK